MTRRSFLLVAGSVIAHDRHRMADAGGLQYEIKGDQAIVAVRGVVRLEAGQRLVLSQSRDHQGKRLASERPLRVLFDSSSEAKLVVERGGHLLVEGDEKRQIEFVTDPIDPPRKPVLELKNGSKCSFQHASFINVALRIEGQHHEFSHVSVQYAGDQPCFSFAGARGRYSRLFAHHSTWGFSFEPLDGKSCDLLISDSCIRSCAKGGKGARYLSGGGLRAVQTESGAAHKIGMHAVDWDPTWDQTDGAVIQASGSRPRIVALGDSIVQGSPGYVNFWNYIPGNDDIENSWPYLFQKRARQFFVINRGEGGFITREMLERLPGIIKFIKPEYCFLGGGTNNLETLSTSKQVYSDFVRMWDTLQTAGIVPIQLAITPNSKSPHREERIIEANNLLRAGCAERSIRFEDVYSLFVNDSGRGLKAVDSADGLHLNKAGYRLLADSLSIPSPRRAASNGCD